MTDANYLRHFDNIEQVDLFARGLYYLAGVDGIDDTEIKVIEEFLEEMDAMELMEALGQDKSTFSLPAAVQAFETTHMRAMFLKTAILLIRADGVISTEESNALNEIADAFGLRYQLPHYEEELDQRDA